MRRLNWLILFLFLPLAAHAQEQPWQVFKSTHFLIYYKSAKESQLNALAARAENDYNKITDDLGFNRFNFWTWDNRAKIYLFDTQKQYMEATGNPEWSAGQAQINGKLIRTFITARGFLDNILPHEMAHIIFREMVGFNNPGVPLWLEEGVATYQEKKNYFLKSELAARINQGKFIGLDELSRMNVSLLEDKELVSLFYNESYSLVRYLIDAFGKDKFVLFCQNLRDKRDLTRALVSAYSFKDLRDFEDSWKKYILR
ncbi:MAG: peptidase MA family metallohydrolase [Candidatus Omnitrophica bacterium]|nr:peptidase MA family metallohydrolase [Candidatus Omnitrophota bacterium]MDD5770976.1 peptidase MA family metallohydrolase [Candidatus Omnitrophota bacterium]